MDVVRLLLQPEQDVGGLILGDVLSMYEKIFLLELKETV